MTCSVCKTDYPEDCLSEMVTSEGVVGGVCGICALRISNRMHGGRPRTRFDGPMAEAMRQRAIAHRKRLGLPEGS